MNNIYIYNETLVSMLNLIVFLINNNITPNNIKNDNYTPTLFDNLIKLDLSLNDKVLEKIDKLILKYIYDVFISDDKNKEIIIFYFYKNYLKYGIKVINMFNLKCVINVRKISKYVRHESHKYKGFIRFRELKNNILYAEIEPINNILFLVSNHFKNRLKNEYWIIKDNKYNLISIYDKNSFKILNDIYLKDINFSNDEKDTQNMWKTFYNTIGIKERKNDRCRMNFMPKRYWKYILEMDDENEKNS